MDLVRGRHADFGPTFAQEKLVEVHGLALSAETLRKWMVEDGLRRVRPRGGPPARQRRLRRPCMGDLVQVDGSEPTGTAARWRCTRTGTASSG